MNAGHARDNNAVSKDDALALLAGEQRRRHLRDERCPGSVTARSMKGTNWALGLQWAGDTAASCALRVSP